MSNAKFNLKVMINKEKTKVLFAEVGSDFADVLLSFLTLPLGEIVRVLNIHYGANAPVIGSLTALYKGVSVLDSVLFSSDGAKQMLLNPRSWFNDGYRKLKLSVTKSQPAMYFRCELSCDQYTTNVGVYYWTARCSCGRVMRTKIIDFPDYPDSDNRSGGVLSADTASFIICDDMRIMPNVMGSFLKTHRTLGITDTKDAELSNVTLGINEIMDLLKGMFMSSTPLTDVILKNKQLETLKFIPGKIMKANSSNNSKKMILNVMVQKSTNKLLFAQAEEDFVDFLFSLLTIPLAGVESLLGKNTCLKSIDNFYTSLESSISVFGGKNMLLNPSRLLYPVLPYCYLSGCKILPLQEDEVPSVYFNAKTSSTAASFSPKGKPGCCYTRLYSIKSPKGDLNYVKGPRMYMVTDDLTVTPLCMSTGIFHLDSLNIPMSDVAELEFDIGLEEALTILKASLSSTCALTNSLLLSKKPVKQEQY